jgi:hypothetical protein
MCYLSKIHLKELNFKQHSTLQLITIYFLQNIITFSFTLNNFFSIYLSFFSDILNSDIFSHTKMKKIEKYELIIMNCNYLKW